MATTPRLGMVLLAVAQSQKELSVNNALTIIDTLLTRLTGDTMTGALLIQPAAATGTVAPLFQPVAAADTALTASTESPSLLIDLSATRQFATGSFTTQRAIRVRPPTYSAVGASQITNIATLAIEGGPITGANMTLVNPYALWVQTGGIRVTGHMFFDGSPAPTAAAGANNGTSPPAPTVVAGATDTRGTIQFGSGTGPAAGAQVAVTWNLAFSQAPYVLLTPGNTATAALQLAVTSITTAGFTVSSAVAPTPSQGGTTYQLNYWAIQ